MWGPGSGISPSSTSSSRHYRRAQLRWNRFWCRDEHHPELAAYRGSDDREKSAIRERLEAPLDPATIDQWNDAHDEAVEKWERVLDRQVRQV